MIIQRNRIYSLVVGSGDDFIEINNLQMTFKVIKTSSNKDRKNSCVVEIYNLSKENQKKLEEDYVFVELKVGYSDYGLISLFSGQVVNMGTKRSGNIVSKRESENTVTTIELDVFHTELNGQTLSKIIPAGKKIRDVITEISKSLEGISHVEMNGKGVEREATDGYPLSGTPRQQLDEISIAYNIEWQIDGNTLYISDRDGSFQKENNKVFSLGEQSGLISRPFYTTDTTKKIKRKKGEPKKRAEKNSIEFMILLNPTLIAGSIIYLEYEDYTGYYKVLEVEHTGDFRGDAWQSKVLATEMGG